MILDNSHQNNLSSYLGLGALIYLIGNTLGGILYRIQETLTLLLPFERITIYYLIIVASFILGVTSVLIAKSVFVKKLRNGKTFKWPIFILIPIALLGINYLFSQFDDYFVDLINHGEPIIYDDYFFDHITNVIYIVRTIELLLVILIIIWPSKTTNEI